MSERPGRANAVDPADLALVEGSHGKPRLAESRLHFNVAHSGSVVPPSGPELRPVRLVALVEALAGWCVAQVPVGPGYRAAVSSRREESDVSTRWETP